MSDTVSSHADAQEAEITYSLDEMLDKLRIHNINPNIAYTKLGANSNQLTSQQKALSQDSFLYQLSEAVKNWRSHQSSATFTTKINQLIYLWLSAYDENADTDSILNILKCFQFNGFFNFSKSTKFHLFMHHLFIETLNRYHQITLDYVLNYDENIQLPNTKQLVSNIALVLDQAEKEQITALFSLHFQTGNNNFLLPKAVSQDLNKQLATILKNNIPSHSQLYFNGDYQFELLITQIDNTTQLDLLVAKLFRAFEEIVFINKQSIIVKPFIGCSYASANQSTANEIYQNAKQALEHAIGQQKNYIVYSNEMQQIKNVQIILESNVLEAFDSNNLTLNFQPIIDINTSLCVGAELLLRWSDKFGKNIPPNLIIEVLNNVGKGKLFTRWLINSACRYAHELLTMHQLDLYLTLNLRAEDLYDTELPSLFSNALLLWKLNPKNIILEITENGILEDNEQTNTVIQTLHELGFKFALDDFGTGFSSLTRLRTLPIDLIKIDQSFIKNIHHSKEDYEIVQSIALLATSLGKKVLAEGVEDKESLSLMKKLNIDKCQGFYFAKALPFEMFIEWVKAHQLRQADIIQD
jgi:EAL domain-containing protein (putative c-di-GMP-specific phosphodiesterase class I)/GGDEF domain-containing protein